MSLDLNPEVESLLIARAEAEGTTASEYIARLLHDASPPRRNAAVPAYDSVLAFLNAQLRDAENATPEEVAEAEGEWRQFKQDMNDTRRANRERPLFSEASRR